MAKGIKIFLLLLIPFGLKGQPVLSVPSIDTLRINLLTPKIISYRGEKINLFENYIDGKKYIVVPQALPDGKYMAFFLNDTAKPAIEVSYLNKKINGFQKRYDNNKLLSVENYKNGNLYGESIYYDKDGKAYEKIYCKKNGRCCVTNRYANNGAVVETIKHNKNKSIVKKYDLKGKLIRKEFWVGNKCVKSKEYDK